MNLPTKITVIRVFLIPIMLLFAMPAPAFLDSWGGIWADAGKWINQWGLYAAAAVFVAAALTDLLDGYLARRMKVVTDMGIFLDPIADKLLVASALIALNTRQLADGWMVVIIIAREFIVSGLRLVAAGKGMVVTADKIGKLKTLTQMIAIVALFIGNFPLSLLTDFDFGYCLLWLATLLTIYSGFNYLRINRQVLKS